MEWYAWVGCAAAFFAGLAVGTIAERNAWRRAVEEALEALDELERELDVLERELAVRGLLH